MYYKTKWKENHVLIQKDAPIKQGNCIATNNDLTERQEIKHVYSSET